jgi:hypothetical protein
MSTMLHQLVTASLLLCFLAVSASGQQQLNGEQLDSVEHVGAISMKAKIAISDSLRNIKGSESVSSIALEELSGYGVQAVYLDATCTTFAQATIYPLNVCYYDTAAVAYVKITATSSTYTQARYSDAKCTVGTDPGTAQPYSTECNAKSKFFLQPSKEVTSTSQSLIYAR